MTCCRMPLTLSVWPMRRSTSASLYRESGTLLCLGYFWLTWAKAWLALCRSPLARFTSPSQYWALPAYWLLGYLRRKALNAWLALSKSFCLIRSKAAS
ncbi:hypothetical protein D3C73_1455370 [compost metagenome]